MASSSLALADNIRATNLNSVIVSDLLLSKKTHVVEFRQGDQVPLNFKADGDLFDSKNDFDNILNIKRTFFIKVSQNNISLSMDGNVYKPIKEAIKGNLSVGSEASPIPGIIQVLLEVYLK